MKILDAFKLAAQLHTSQVDKAGRPYIEHLSRVFLRTLEAGGDRDQQIAALLHDAIEDGKATIDELLQAGVPQRAIDLVLILTRFQGMSYEFYLQRVAKSPEARLIKRADLADNSDPERLAALPAELADKLRAKYAKAAEIIGA